MKQLITCLALFAMASFLHAQTVTNYFPNGTFEDYPGAPSGPGSPGGWEESSSANVAFSYPTNGGNPGAYGIMDHLDTADGFGVWVSADGNTLPLDDYGMVPGGFYDFTMDMREISVITEGLTPPGLKVEFFGPNGFTSNTGDLLGDNLTGSWATYTYFVVVPAEANEFKVVPLNVNTTARVGFDNIGVVVPEQPLVASILSPTEGASIGSPVMTIVASATVSPGSVTNVSFYDGATLIGTDTSAPWSIDYISAVGAHALSVVATDDSGNSVTSLVVNVTTEPSTAVLIPNGDFESSPPGTNWSFNSVGSWTIDFPTTGGSPGGFGRISGNGAANTNNNEFAVLITGNTPLSGDPLPIDPLGLVGGQTYTFFQAVKTFTNGTGTGAVKYEWYNSGNVKGNEAAYNVATSADWQTNAFAATLDANAYGLKIVPVGVKD